MNIIGIASYLYSSTNTVTFEPRAADTQLRGNARRVTRTKTLDGGVVIVDGGICDGDRTLKIAATATAALWTSLWAVFQGAALVTITTEEACFLAKVEDIAEDGEKITIKALVWEILSA
jgi:hypothetical protein